MWLVDVVILVVSLLAVTPVAVLLVRDLVRVRGQVPARPPEALEPEQIAALNTGDDDHVVLTALAPLRFGGVLDADEDGRLAVTGTALAGASELTRAVHAAIDRATGPIRTPDLAKDPAVAAEVERVRRDLTDRGLLLAPWQRRRIVTDRLVLAGIGLAVVTFAVTRTGVFAVPGLVALAIGAVVVALLLIRARRTEAGEALLRSVIAAERRLDPAAAPDWAQLTPSSIAVAVAVYGTIVLALADPTFAAAAQIEGRRTDATNALSSDTGDDGVTPGYWGGHIA
jgi:uncharacterized protein (TIGR04222 family)